MADVELKTKSGTKVNIMTCTSVDDLFTVYKAYRDNYTILVNGEELEKPHWRNKDSYFAGYTKKFFEKFF